MCSCLHSSSLQVEAHSSLQRCFVTELLMVSAFTGWLGKSPFPPGDTRQLWLSRGQGRQQRRESCSEQLPCKATMPLLHVCGHSHILLQTPCCFHAVPPAGSQHSSWQDLGTPVQTRSWHRVSVRRATLSAGHLGAGRGSEMLPTPAHTLCWGSDSSAPIAARDEKQPFPMSNFSSPP